MKALWIAKTGLDAQQTRMAVISNNLANANTTGFKKGRAVFEDLIYQNVRQPGAQSSQDTQLPSGLMLGTGVRVVATEKIYTQGNLMQTGNALDVAIEGRGFFQVLLPDGNLAYTREGAFQVRFDGQLVTAGGYEVQPGITIPDNAQSGVDQRGRHRVGGGARRRRAAGDRRHAARGLRQSRRAAAARPQPAHEETAASGAPQVGTPGLTGLGSLIQGSLESSNVNTVEELVNMIETQRAYEINSKAIATAATRCCSTPTTTWAAEHDVLP
jgi:flagellar basal-body rod protein FlgG